MHGGVINTSNHRRLHRISVNANKKESGKFKQLNFGKYVFTELSEHQGVEVKNFNLFFIVLFASPQYIYGILSKFNLKDCNGDKPKQGD